MPRELNLPRMLIVATALVLIFGAAVFVFFMMWGRRSTYDSSCIFLSA